MAGTKHLGARLSFFLGLLLLPQPLLAGGTQFWETFRQADFLKGDLHNLSVAENGTLSVAPRLDRVVDTGQPYIWSAATDSAGNVFLGTGHDGRVFVVSSKGTATVVADFEELDVTAVAVDQKGGVYAATSPDGRVYRINSLAPASGAERTNFSVYFDPAEKYIWALLVRGDGRIVVGTGAKGKVYQVDTAGKGTVLFDPRQANVTALALDTDGSLLVGTDPDGLVLRIDDKGKCFAVFDAPQREIHRLAQSSEGTWYILAVNDKSPGALSLPAPVMSGDPRVSVSLSITPEEPDLTSTASSNVSSPAKSDVGSSQSVLYALSRGGEPEALWVSNEAVGFDILPRPNGTVLIGTGTQGRVYQVDGEGRSQLVLETGEDHVSRFLAAGDAVFVATNNFGKLFRFQSVTSLEGVFTSPVLDAKFVSQWGQASWRGQGEIKIQTRTGNTGTPDETWSDWSVESVAGELIKSPQARYLQWRVKLQGTSRLESVRIAYLPKNVAPRITSLTVLSPGIALQENPQPPVDPAIINAGLDPTGFGLSGPVPPRRVFQKGARSLQWQAEDRNGDQLQYRVFYRSVGGGPWQAVGEELRVNYLTLNADALPDGVYEFKVEAGDLPSNFENTALVSSRVSEPVEIDNTPPVVTWIGTPRRSEPLRFEVSDAVGVLKRVEVMVDGRVWRPVVPDDGVLDGRKEQFTVPLKLSSGDHAIAVRVFDSCANVGGEKTILRESEK